MSTSSAIFDALELTSDLTTLPNLPAFQKKKINQLPAVPAVYAVFDPPATILYIGRSKNIRKRFETHTFAVTRWRVIWFEISIEEQAELERTLISHFHPDFNIQHNPTNRRVRGHSKVITWPNHKNFS